MILTAKQEEGLRIAVARYKSKEKYTCISGFAGSGKSTLIKFIIKALPVNSSLDVAYATFTGKAAQVLRQKGCPNAMTLHKLLYQSVPLPNGKFIFTPRPSIEYKIVVVDEVSMVSQELWDLLMSYNVYILACGDPGQLSPISKEGNCDILKHPHVFLDEIMRQAQESEIIRLSMDIREGRPINYYKGKEIQIIPQSEVIDGMLTWADQIITATNKMRCMINTKMRAAANRSPIPEIGDKIICGRNCWSILDTLGLDALVNGTIGYISDIVEKNYRYNHYQLSKPVPLYFTSIETDYGDEFINIPIDKTYILTGKKFLTSEQEYVFYKSKKLQEEPRPIEFDFGYAITCHRAQGSQWDKILVFEENFPFDKEEHRRWLYTAVTRAADRVVLVR